MIEWLRIPDNWRPARFPVLVAYETRLGQMIPFVYETAKDFNRGHYEHDKYYADINLPPPTGEEGKI